MIFPQLLWRIAINGMPVIIRRGNNCNEPIDKSLRKDAWEYVGVAEKTGYPIIGVFEACDINDNELYSQNHQWDWMNE